MNKYLTNMIEALQTLIRIDSVESKPLEGKPFGEGCYMALNYTLCLCQSLGLKTKNLEGYAGHAEIGEGELFGILTHLDTVPHGSGWDYPPTSGQLIDDRIYGRGALDDKSPAIACIYAVKALLDEGLTPKKKIRLIFGCDEESGWKCMEHYFQNEEMPQMGFSPDADFPVINCEKGVSYYHIRIPKTAKVIEIMGGERANMVPDYASATITVKPLNTEDVQVTYYEDSYKIEALGTSVHASHSEKGDNALWKIFRVLSSTLGGVYTKIYTQLCNTNGIGCNLNISDTTSGDLTMNLGTASTSEEDIELSLDTRFPITFTKEQLLDILQKDLDYAEVKQGAFHDPLFVDPNHPLVQSLLSAYTEVTKKEAQPITIGGGTYARALPLGVAFGPMFPNGNTNIHCANEYISVPDLLEMSKIYYTAIKKLCF